MTTKIELSRKWVQFKRGAVSLHIRSFKECVNSKGLNVTGKYLLSELRKMDDINKVMNFFNNEEFYSISLVFISPEFTVLKSDTVRSAPLFYTTCDHTIYISDQIKYKNEFSFDTDSIIEMVETGYVSGSQTVYKNVFGVQAAEIVIFKKITTLKDRFFKYDIDRTVKETKELNLKPKANRLDNILKDIFQDLIEGVPDKGRVIVPLSGGHDSRMIVNYLHKLDFNDVLCYSYGIPGNIQSKISKQVAGALGYDWHFIEYTDKKWGELHSNGEFDQYIEYAFNGVSNPHLQDFLAVYELKKNNVLKAEDIFVPGHGLDILCEVLNLDNHDEDVIELSVNHYGRFSKIPIDENSILYKRYAEIFKNSGVTKTSFPDYLLWQERAAKFTVNSLRVYEFYGYDTRIPFWDIRVVKFWLDIDRRFKLNKETFLNMENEYLLTQELKGVPFGSFRNISNREKENLKDYIPSFLKILYLRISKRKQPQAEGLNLIYNTKAASVLQLLGSIDNWPDEIIKNLGNDLKRYPFQINHHFLTRLYTISKLF